MGDEIGSQDARGKKSKFDYFQWSDEMADELLSLLVEEVKNGNRMANENFKKYTIENNVIPTLEEKFGKVVKYEQIYNKMKTWKKKLEPVESVIKNNSGFGFDSTTNRLTCSDETWDNILKAHPNTPPSLRNKYFARFDDYVMVVGSHGATGKGASGLGADGVEDVRLENIVEDDIIMGSTPPPVNESVSAPSVISSGRKRRETNGATATSNTDNQDPMLNEYVKMNNTLDTLTNEVKLMRTRNVPWLDAVNSTSGFTYVQKWNVINDTTISQDSKDNFVQMNETERCMFLRWRLGLDMNVPATVGSDDETQDFGGHNDFFDS